MRAGRTEMTRLSAAAAGGLLALSLAGCGASGNVRTAAAEASGDGTLAIALLLDNAGGEKGLGKAQQAAAELAVAEVNADGGLKGRPVELLPKADADDIAAAAQSYVDAGADVVIGPTDSAQAPVAIEVLAPAQVAIISPANGASGLSEYDSGGYYFRTYPSDVLQAYALAGQLRDAGKQDISIVHEDSSYGEAVAAALQEARSGEGLETTMISAADGIPDAVSEAEAADADAIVVVARSSAQAILGGLANSTIDPARLYLSSGATDQYGDALAVGALDGAHGFLPGVLPEPSFQSRLLEIDPGLEHLTFASATYDAVMLAVLAAAAAHDDGGTSIAANLLAVSGNAAGAIERNGGNAGEPGTECETFPACMDLIQDGEAIDYQGVSGPVQFDVHGDLTAARFSFYEYGSENTPGYVSDALISAPLQ